MKRHSKKIIAGSALLLTGVCAHAQFTAGDLVVLRDGAGTAPLSNAGTAIFLDEFNTAGSAVYSVAIPSTGGTALVNSGTATSEGEISLSPNGQNIVLAGYNANAGTAAIASTTSTAAPRGVATVNANGNYSLSATSTSFYSGNNIRSGTIDGSGNIWAAGANGGIAYMGSGTPGLISTTSVNNRVLQNIGGNLYFSTGSGSTRGIYQISGNPTSGSTTATSFINASSIGTVSPYDFAFNSSMTVAYIADSDAYTTSAGVGGIEKWDFNGTSWAFQYSLPTVGVGANGLAVDFSGANPVIYATSGDGTSLFDVTDTGSSATATLLDTAGSNEAFRGLTWAPTAVPEPSVLALLAAGLPGAYLWVRRNRKA
ncbi:MAG TPA: PEP-CTERM sorting domain-containing protein [Pseudomonadales bacterium]|nr:PEP-CTERM sorting domain-containing protein [Pseudomonadales bacterium]